MDRHSSPEIRARCEGLSVGVDLLGLGLISGGRGQSEKV